MSGWPLLLAATNLDQRLGECGPGGARRSGSRWWRRCDLDAGHVTTTIRRFTATVAANTARKVSQGPSTQPSPSRLLARSALRCQDAADERGLCSPRRFAPQSALSRARVTWPNLVT